MLRLGLRFLKDLSNDRAAGPGRRPARATAADAAGREYNKGDSYMRWVNMFANDLTGPFKKPPILLHHSGKLMHIGGQTRQTGALTNKKILPYLILST